MSEEKKLPEWIQEKENGNLLVKTKEGDFELEEQPYEKIVQAKKRFTRTNPNGIRETDNDKLQLALISESLVTPKKGELELMKFKGSTVFRLSYAINQLYDLASFLV